MVDQVQNIIAPVILLGTVPVILLSTAPIILFSTGLNLPASNMPALASTGTMVRQLLESTILVLNVSTSPALKVSTESQY